MVRRTGIHGGIRLYLTNYIKDIFYCNCLMVPPGSYQIVVPEFRAASRGDIEELSLMLSRTPQEKRVLSSENRNG